MVNKEIETIEFRYTIGEMCVYLKGNGYTVESINVRHSYSLIVNGFTEGNDFIKRDLMIAYKGNHPYPNHKKKPIVNHLIEQEVGVVFRHELSRKLLEV